MGKSRENIKCFNCEGSNIEIAVKPFYFEDRGFEVRAACYVCDRCGECYMDTAQMDYLRKKHKDKCDGI